MNILIGWIAGFFIYVSVVSKKYKTTFGKAFLASLIYTIIGFCFLYWYCLS
ncbi:membrane protein [Beggiatoa sp. PS]|nr:membrane protein [Beggiatoa sp. PS]